MSSPQLRHLPALGNDNTIIQQDQYSPADDKPSSPSFRSHQYNYNRLSPSTHTRLHDRPLELYRKHMQLNLHNIWFKRIRNERQNPIRTHTRLPDRPLELYIE
jgi:hypothetical protein